MKTLIFIFLLALPLSGWAQNKNLAVGVFIGSPTSLTAKYWTTQKSAYQFSLAFDFDDYILVTGDYLLHYPGTFKTTESFINSLVPYIGFGGIAVVTTEDRRRDDDYLGKESGSLGLGLRIPMGVEWRSTDPSISVYFEFSPGISIIPETSALFMGGLGIRFHF